LLLLLAVLSVCLAMYAIYAAAFFAWLTATPLSGAQLTRVQHDCYAWFLIFLAASTASVVLIRLNIKRCRIQRRQSAFPMADGNVK
jgi:hypothetical protein